MCRPPGQCHLGAAAARQAHNLEAPGSIPGGDPHNSAPDAARDRAGGPASPSFARTTGPLWGHVVNTPAHRRATNPRPIEAHVSPQSAPARCAECFAIAPPIDHRCRICGSTDLVAVRGGEVPPAVMAARVRGRLRAPSLPPCAPALH